MSTESVSLGYKIFSTLTPNSPRHVSLEDKLECHGITQEVLDGNSVCGRGMTRLIAKTDWEKCLRDAQNHQSTAVAAEIASSTSLGHGVG